jgi:hypothetical protein
MTALRRACPIMTQPPSPGLPRALDQLIALPDLRQRLAANGRLTVRRFAIDQRVASRRLDTSHDRLSRPSRHRAQAAKHPE